MNSTFVRFYATVMAVFVVVFVAATAILWWDSSEYAPDVMERELGPGLQLARDRMQEAHDPTAELAALRRTFSGDLDVVPVATLPAEVRGRVSAGEVVYWDEELDSGMLAVGVGEGTALRHGPLHADWLPELTDVALAFALAIVAFAVTLAFLLAPQFRHLQQLERAALDVGAGDFTCRVPLTGDVHQQRVAEAFNHTVERIGTLVEGQTELLRAISHELRTPLARLRFRVEMLPDVGDAAAELDQDIGALDELVTELLTLSRLEGPAALARSRIELKPELHDIVESRAAALPNDDVALEVQATTKALDVDPTLFGRAIGNLVANAIRHASSRVWVEASSDDAGNVRVDVSDDGPGIPAEDRARAFEPFERLGEDDSAGTGLGLAIVRRVVEAHRGRVEIGEREAGGCVVKTWWPQA
ncbi:MAG: ATP-binding protein [Myxococcota bacterium]